MEEMILERLVRIEEKLDKLVADNEQLAKERQELAEQMKGSGLGAIFSAIAEQ